MYFINKQEYERLLHEKMANPVYWSYSHDVCVESVLKSIFEENKFLEYIFSHSDYPLLKYDKSNFNMDFNHYYAIKLKKNACNIEDYETVTGIMNFSYNILWDDIEEIFSKMPESWSLFILNPILIRYRSTIGVFLTPKHYNDFFINECSEFVKLKTGYPLFLKYNSNPEIKILYEKPDLSLKNYVCEMKKHANLGLSKLLDFWANNDCVSVNSFEISFDDYMDNLSFNVWEDINFKDITSTIPFEIINIDTEESLGVFKRFNLDKSFKLADTDFGVLKLTDKELNNLLEGKYDFKLMR